MSQPMKRFLQAVAAVAICASLLPTAADAAQKKKVEPRRVHRVYGMTKHQSVVRAVIPAVYEKNGDPALKSTIALVMDQDTHEILLAKNDSTVQPIASITKLMTGLLISEAKLPSDEMITITQDDVDTEKHSSSRLRVGTTLSRGELLNLALMSSENRAAHALGRTYPGGLEKFVELMNSKAQMLGMKDTHYVEPTGLSSHNESSAQDLATLVKTAYDDPLLREYTTMPGKVVAIGKRNMEFHNTNRLVKNPDWDIGLQKTGYINEAGRCLVMQAKVAGRKLIMVFLDSAGRLSRIADAERVRHWLERQASAPTTGSTVIRQVNG
jgi:serine-type D-Ala-D-Ala endopeptidase (penicillin-binding protein 7)